LYIGAGVVGIDAAHTSDTTGNKAIVAVDSKIKSVESSSTGKHQPTTGKC